ncbi:MAG: DEAD/DEAH box helicase [Candidatus Woesearchaeota archaeon]|nr:DEAD/DEAH box helicase [Candidatus Woesearchaeota archaeon]
MENIEFQTKPYKKKEILDNLHPFVREWFTNKFEDFSPPQYFSIRNIQLGINSLISSPTGSGKTLSSFLTIINDLVTRADLGTLEHEIACIYISPLKALANDINKNLTEPLKEIKAIAKKYDKDVDIRVGTRTGDTTPSQKAGMLKKPPHILITTPESVAIALASSKFSLHLRTTKYVIIDEIHALAENKRGTHLSLSLERLARRAQFTRIGLSATVAPLEDVAAFLVGYDNGKPRPCKIIDAAATYQKKMDLKVLSPVKDIIDTPHMTLQNNMYELIHHLVQTHRTTLIFTNTRSGTERVIHQLKARYPMKYANVLDADEERKELIEAEGKQHEHLAEEAEIPEEIKQKGLIGAHHGSLAKKHRLKIETMLKEGKLQLVSCSTSLELGIDIGYIDLVILLGSPKSVARALQRIGRSGHKLHDEAKGRIIVLDRDDLVECSVLLKAAIERKIDKINMPKNALDVMAQHIYGMAIEEITEVEDAWQTITSAAPYHTLERKDFDATLAYLAGEHAQLQERSIYSKIWMEDGKFGKRGKLARLIYMTNIGTIPDETSVKVKIGDAFIGTITEEFVERLKPGDVFVLGGEPYEFKFTRGTTAQVRTSAGRLPTVPSWISEMLPLNYDLALEIQKFRKYMSQQLNGKKTKKEILDWIRNYLYVDEHGVHAVYNYLQQQDKFSEISHTNKLLLEHFKDGNKKYVFVHSLHGRRVNDVLARAIAYVNGRITNRDVEVGVNDNGFFLKSTQPIQALRSLKLLKPEDLPRIMELALDKSEVLKRRFRHCAGRSLMILRKYKGREKSVGKQQISAQIIMNAVKKIGNDFPILKEARREILEDLMDIQHAVDIVTNITKKKMKVVEKTSDIPSPFAFNLMMQGYTDLLKMEDRVEFVRRLHNMVLQEIQGKKPEKVAMPAPSFTYDNLWNEQAKEEKKKQEDYRGYLSDQLRYAAVKGKVPPDYQETIQRMINEEKFTPSESFDAWLTELLGGTIPRYWKDDLVQFLRKQ